MNDSDEDNEELYSFNVTSAIQFYNFESISFKENKNFLILYLPFLLLVFKNSFLYL